MAKSIQIDETGVPPQHQFDVSKVGRGKEHENVSLDGDGEMFIHIKAFRIHAGLSIFPPEEGFEEPDLLMISRSVADGVKCLVDTGANVSMFRSEVARELGLDPGDGKISEDPIIVVGGERDCCRCRHVLYLEIGPYPIPVPVEFPVKRINTGTTAEYQWLEDFPDENILGMEAILDKRMLCFTRDSLFVFENRQ